jgi:hypothetical protein
MKRLTHLIVVGVVVGTLWTPAAWAEDKDKGQITCGQIKSETITSPGERHIWRFTAQAGDRVLIGTNGTTGSKDERFDLYQPDDGPAELVGEYGLVSHQLQKSGTYEIVMYEHGLDEACGYTLTLQNLTACPATKIAPCGEILSGAAAVGGLEVYEFSGQAGDRIVIGTHSDSVYEYADLYPPDGGGLELRAHGLTSHVLGKSGTYKMVVFDSGLDTTGDYTITLQNLSACSGTPITCGQTVSGHLGVNGLNVYELTGQVGDRIVIGTHSDSVYEYADLYPPDGGGLELRAHGLTSHVLGKSGTYKMVVFDSGLDTTGDYTLTFDSSACGPAPDLMLSVVVDPNRIVIPEDANVVCTIVNNGEVNAVSTSLKVYRSADPNLDEQDILIGEVVVPALPPRGESIPSKFTLKSVGCTPGRWWVIGEVNAVPEERNVSNNVASATVAIGCSLDICLPEGGHVESPGEGDVFPHDCGKEVPIKAINDECYHFVRWTGTAVDLGKVFDPNDPNTTALVDGAYTLCPIFARDVVLLSISSVGCGGVEPNEGTHEYECGAIVPVKAFPCECYRFTHWTGTAVDANRVADPRSPDTTVIVDASYTLRAHFELKTCTLTVVSGQGGSVHVRVPGEDESIVSSGEQRQFEYDCNAPVTLRAVVADPNCHFIGWGGTCVIDPNQVMNPEITVVCIDGCTLEARFTCVCGLTITHTGCGHVEPNEGPGEYVCGASVAVTAVPCDCYDFSRWSGSVVPLGKEHDNPITVQVAEADALCAHFIRHTYTVTLSSTGSGRLLVSPDPCDVVDGNQYVYGCGTCTQITAVPEKCYTFSHWSGSAVDRGKVPNPNDPNLKLCMDDDYTLTANFAPAKYDLTIIPDPNGAAAAYRNGPYDCGESVRVWAMPNEYCQFTEWSGTAVDAGMVLTPDRPDPNVLMYGDYTIKANFVCEQRTLDVSSTAGGYLNVTVVRDNKSTIWLGEGTYHFDRGTVVTVEATAEPGYEFTNWSGMVWSTDRRLMLTLDEDLRLEANFRPIPQP